MQNPNPSTLGRRRYRGQTFCIVIAIGIGVGCFAKAQATLPSPSASAAPTATQALTNFKMYNTEATPTTFKDAACLEVRTRSHDSEQSGLVTVLGPDFHNGSIELEIAGNVAPDADATARGFVGIAFRVADARSYEAFYLRPTNGRADDQLRRNHALQYVSEPAYPWYRLRRETPGRYESYADLQPGVWTRMRVIVAGTTATLFVNDARQPSLIVHDLKRGDGSGAVAYWVGPEAIGYFRDLKVIRN